MPVSTQKNGAAVEKNAAYCAPGHMHHGHISHFGKSVLLALFGILLAYLIVLTGTLIRNNIQKYDYIGHADLPERTLMVDAQAKVTATPDIAITTMGMTAEAPTVAEAQTQNTSVMNTLVERLKALGVAEADIQTSNYSIYPQYDYTDEGGQELRGYQVQQQVTVKIRDLTKSSAIIGLAGEVGANTVSELSFTIDDNEVYKQQARELALQKVAAKARSLSEALGVRIGDVVAYAESEGGGVVPPYLYMAKESDMGGGGMMPSVQPGSMEVMMNVMVTFEIL